MVRYYYWYIFYSEAIFRRIKSVLILIDKSEYIYNRVWHKNNHGRTLKYIYDAVAWTYF